MHFSAWFLGQGKRRAFYRQKVLAAFLVVLVKMKKDQLRRHKKSSAIPAEEICSSKGNMSIHKKIRRLNELKKVILQGTVSGLTRWFLEHAFHLFH